ncbi:MAG TPA: DinB family protein [Terriglobales bacterium]
MTEFTARPHASEASAYYFRYIDQVPTGDLCAILADQLAPTISLLHSLSDEQSLYRYAPDKWTVREVLKHLSDTERLFCSRAFWFARGFDTPLPSFDQEQSNLYANANATDWTELVAEFESVRRATLSFFHTLSSSAWDCRGVASGNPFSVRAIAYIIAGHTTHHLNSLMEQYLGNDSYSSVGAR